MDSRGLARRDRWGLLMRPYGLTRGSLFILTFLALGVVALPAAAHGLLKDANPAPDVKLTSVPDAVSVTLTQPPMPNGELSVRDGCGLVVSGGSNVDDDVISADIASAQPGRWRVQFDFVSATDGHRYGSSYSFSVKGERDCNQDQDERKEGTKGEGEEDKMGSDDRSRDDMASDSENDDHTDGQSVPVGGLVVASVIAFSTGLIARLRPRTS